VAITTGDGLIAASKQLVPYTKTAAVTTIALNRHTIRGAAGNPGAGTLASLGATIPGAVPTDATSGMPTINAFGGGATGYLSRVNWNNSVVGRIELWDILYAVNIPSSAAGFQSLQTLTVTAPSSYLGRCPSGHGDGCRIFLWATTQVAANAVTITVTYTNSAGTGSRSTGASGSLSGLIVGRWIELPLQAGDSGVDEIDTVVVGGTAAATGAINVIVVRPLWTNRVPLANGGDLNALDKTGMPIVYADSALILTSIPDSTAAGIPDLSLEIANG
jgi:hypothetical protein